MANSIAQDRVNRLDSIGFKWAILKPGSITPWETRFDELDKYKAKHGDCNVPARQGKLGRWVSKQRTVCKAGSLSQDRIDRLDGIGFNWTPPLGSPTRRKAPPSPRKQSLSRKGRVSSSSTNVNYRSVGDGARGAEPNGFAGEGRNATAVMSVKVPSKRSDHNEMRLDH